MLKALLLIPLLVLVSCAEVESKRSSVSDGGAQNSNKLYTLTWTSPSNFENDDPLSVIDDLQEYRVYYGDSRGNVTQNFTTVNASLNTFSTQEFNADLVASIATVYVAMTSVSKDGVESVLSEIVTFNP